MVEYVNWNSINPSSFLSHKAPLVGRPPSTAPQAGRGLSPSPTCTGPLPSKQYWMGRLTSELSSSAQLLSRCPLGPRPPCSSHLDIGVWGTQVCVGQSRQLLQLQQQGSVLQGPGQGGLVQGQGCWLSESPASVSAQPCLEVGSGEQRGLLFSRRAGVWGGRDLRERWEGGVPEVSAHANPEKAGGGREQGEIWEPWEQTRSQTCLETVYPNVSALTPQRVDGVHKALGQMMPARGTRRRVQIRFLHVEETQSNLLISQMNKLRPSGEVRCSRQWLQSAVCRHLPQNPPGPLSENRHPGPPTSGQEGSGRPTGAWAADPGPSPQHTPLPPGLPKPSVRGLYFLASLTIATFLCLLTWGLAPFPIPGCLCGRLSASESPPPASAMRSTLGLSLMQLK